MSFRSFWRHGYQAADVAMPDAPSSIHTDSSTEVPLEAPIEELREEGPEPLIERGRLPFSQGPSPFFKS
jgi:hypothetical protein